MYMYRLYHSSFSEEYVSDIYYFDIYLSLFLKKYKSWSIYWRKAICLPTKSEIEFQLLRAVCYENLLLAYWDGNTSPKPLKIADRAQAKISNCKINNNGTKIWNERNKIRYNQGKEWVNRKYSKSETWYLTWHSNKGRYNTEVAIFRQAVTPKY